MKPGKEYTEKDIQKITKQNSGNCHKTLKQLEKAGQIEQRKLTNEEQHERLKTSDWVRYVWRLK